MQIGVFAYIEFMHLMFTKWENVFECLNKKGENVFGCLNKKGEKIFEKICLDLCMFLSPC